MKKSKVIGIIIFILLLCLGILAYFIIDLAGGNLSEKINISQTNEVENTADLTNSTTISTNSTNNTISRNETNITDNNSISNMVNANTSSNITNTSTNNTTNSSSSNDIFGDDINNDKNQANNGSFEIKGITNDILQYISDIDNFNIVVKEYILNNFQNVTSAEVQKYEYQENTSRLGIILKLNNQNEDKLRVIVNQDGKIDISNYD